MRKEFQRQVAALQYHPALITPDPGESKSRVEPGSLFKISGRQVGRGGIALDILPTLKDGDSYEGG